MTAPVRLSSACTATVVTCVFDQTLVAPLGRPGEGFTLTVNGIARVMQAAVQSTTTLSNDSVQLTVQGVLSFGDTVLLSYSPATGNLLNGTAEAPTAFTGAAVTNSSVHAGMLARVVAANGTDSNVLTVYFSKPVTATDYTTGVTVKVNGTTVPLSSGAQGSNTSTILLTLSAAVQYSDVVQLSYTGGTWTSGTPIVAFTLAGVINASKLGTASSLYPLSTVVLDLLTALQGTVTATVSVDLNVIDVALLSKYGPQTLQLGGTFGITAANPAGVVVPAYPVVLKDGQTITCNFTVVGYPNWAADAGREWLTFTRTAIQTALTTIRTLDGATDLGTRTISPV